MNFEEYLDKDINLLTSVSNEWIEKLYDKVNNYVKNNYLLEGENDEYVIKYKNIYYEIGYFYGPDLFYFIKKVENQENIKSYIEYTLVKYNLLSMKQIKTKIIIERINESIASLKSDGVSKRLLKKSIKI